MHKFSGIARAAVQALLVAVLGISTSCTSQGLPELRRGKVFLTEWPSKRYTPDNMVLIVELFEKGGIGSYPHAPYVLSGFCGERLSVARIGLGGLFLDSLPDKDNLHGRDADDLRNERGAPVFAVFDLVRSKVPVGRTETLPEYDLRHDDRDLCLATVVPSGMFSALVSNTVKVPHEAVVEALHAGVQPLPPLIPFVAVFMNLLPAAAISR